MAPALQIAFPLPVSALMSVFLSDARTPQYKLHNHDHIRVFVQFLAIDFLTLRFN
jgi:hypothetical protein